MAVEMVEKMVAEKFVQMVVYWVASQVASMALPMDTTLVAQTGGFLAVNLVVLTASEMVELTDAF